MIIPGPFVFQNDAGDVPTDQNLSPFIEMKG
jgi:hypothetical protein